jgi:hypothetical protein
VLADRTYHFDSGGCVGWLPYRVAALAVAAPLAGAAALGADDDPDPDLVAFARAFGAAWSARDLEAILAFFDPNAVIAIGSGGSAGTEDGPGEYRGGGGPLSLPIGVAVLTGDGAQLDLDGRRVAPVAFGGATATVARWPYRRAASPSALPPEIGTDEVVVRGGRILAYTRTPDGASRAARAVALARAMDAMATRTARQPAAAADTAPRAPGATDAPPDAAWPLRLAGLGAGAALLLRWHRRRTHRG